MSAGYEKYPGKAGQNKILFSSLLSPLSLAHAYERAMPLPVGAVLDEAEAVAPANVGHAVHVADLAAHVAQEENRGARVGRRLSLEVVQVHGPRLVVRVV